MKKILIISGIFLMTLNFITWKVLLNDANEIVAKNNYNTSYSENMRFVAKASSIFQTLLKTITNPFFSKNYTYLEKSNIEEVNQIKLSAQVKNAPEPVTNISEYKDYKKEYKE